MSSGVRRQLQVLNIYQHDKELERVEGMAACIRETTQGRASRGEDRSACRCSERFQETKAQMCSEQLQAVMMPWHTHLPALPYTWYCIQFTHSTPIIRSPFRRRYLSQIAFSNNMWKVFFPFIHEVIYLEKFHNRYTHIMHLTLLSVVMKTKLNLLSWVLTYL